jgi:hypothetical protein
MGEWKLTSTYSLPLQQIEYPSFHWIGDWVGLRASLNTLESRKLSWPSRKRNPDSSAVQSAAWSLNWLSHRGAFSWFPSRTKKMEFLLEQYHGWATGTTEDPDKGKKLSSFQAALGFGSLPGDLPPGQSDRSHTCTRPYAFIIWRLSKRWNWVVCHMSRLGSRLPDKQTCQQKLWKKILKSSARFPSGECNEFDASTSI